MIIKVTFVQNSTDEQKVALQDNALGIFDFTGHAEKYTPRRRFYISTTSIENIDQVALKLGWEAFHPVGNFKRFTVESSKSEIIEQILDTFPSVLFTREI